MKKIEGKLIFPLQGLHPVAEVISSLISNAVLHTPTTKAVGSNFVISIEPTALVVGAIKKIWINSVT